MTYNPGMLESSSKFMIVVYIGTFITLQMHAQKQFATAACLNHYVNCTHTPATLAVMSLLGVSCRA